MSLDFKLDRIDDFISVCFTGTGDLKPVTNSLIWATMSVELGEITEGNAPEFWARANLSQKYVGSWWMMGDGSSVVITKEDVIAHIGLRTNVANRTRRQWLNSYLNQYIEDDASDARELLATTPRRPDERD